MPEVKIEITQNDPVGGTWSAPWMMGRNRGEWTMRGDQPHLCEGMPADMSAVVTRAIARHLEGV